ncbi:hypothetical protein GGR56DRAFT_91551 [Xylariaceae sp. FL0804]|nr:hypothetical protein GGR56DRAFT_91551 [Xylariaceae sp. FL0804]
MAPLGRIGVLSALILCSAALQVTPNSPCSSVCADGSGADSLTTQNDDITCLDSEYSTTQAGQRFQSCLSCLQDSTYSQGSETDQKWFFYNMRYAFDYCIFSFPNATGISSSPCTTSFACGQLESSLEAGQLSPGSPDYAYCGAMTSSAVSECQSCVAAGSDQAYLVNFLVALQTSCQQKPAVGKVVGLNETVFSTTTVAAVNPNKAAGGNGNGAAGGDDLSLPQIAGIAAGAVVVALLVAGCLVVRRRKRSNHRRLRLGGGGGGGSGKTAAAAIIGLGHGGQHGRHHHHRPASSLSFRCQAHLSPRSPAFFPSPSSTSTIAQEEEKDYFYPYSSDQLHSALSKEEGGGDNSHTNNIGIGIGVGINFKPPLHSLVTTHAGATAAAAAAAAPGGHHHHHPPRVPGTTYQSPSSRSWGGGGGGGGGWGSPPTSSPWSSPWSPNAGAGGEDATPASAASARSTAQLLPPVRPYNPAEHGVASPALGYGGGSSGRRSPGTSAATATTSPLLRSGREREQQRGSPVVGLWDMPQFPPRRSSFVVGSGSGGGKRVSSKNGSPVESRRLDNIFPGPPPPPRR